MATELIIGILSLLGTTFGTITGIILANRLSIYRIGELEKKLDKYANNVDEMRERMVVVEQSTKSAHHRLDDIVSQLDIHERRK